MDKPDKEEQTALHICVQNAIVHSSYAAVERLLAAGASVNMYVIHFLEYCSFPIVVLEGIINCWFL